MTGTRYPPFIPVLCLTRGIRQPSPVPMPDGYLPRVPGCSHTRVAPYFLLHSHHHQSPYQDQAPALPQPQLVVKNRQHWTHTTVTRRLQIYVPGLLGMYSTPRRTQTNLVSSFVIPLVVAFSHLHFLSST